MDDAVLLSRFAEAGDQESFEEIVSRHSGWVYSVALRAVRDKHLAEDVTQAVFIILAKKARSIREGTPLSGWLFKACRFAVSDALKRRTRMKNRENRFAEFFRATNAEGAAPAEGATDVPDEISHTLDEAVGVLSDSDRQAVLLRFYENKSLAEVGQSLGISEEAAKKRVARAVDKLRKHFATRGMIAPAAVIVGLLMSRSAEAAALPPLFASSVAAGATSGAAHSLAAGAIKTMACAQAKLLGAILASCVAVLVPIAGLTLKSKPAAPSSFAPARSVDRGVYAPTDAVAENTPTTRQPPKDSRFEEVWIGYKGQLLWRSDAYQAPDPQPFYLKRADKHEKPYAVAVDKKGSFYIKPLDKAFLESPTMKEALYDYDQGPTNSNARVNAMLSLIDAPAQGSAAGPSASARGGSTASGGDADSGHGILGERGGEWFPVDHYQDDGGTIVIEQTQPMMDFLRLPGLFDDTFLFDRSDFVGQQVPEPATGLLALAGAALLTLRRGRRKN
jgi:RNA polymerase sigma factor (sigma-70 family)